MHFNQSLAPLKSFQGGGGVPIFSLLSGWKLGNCLVDKEGKINKSRAEFCLTTLAPNIRNVIYDFSLQRVFRGQFCGCFFPSLKKKIRAELGRFSRCSGGWRKEVGRGLQRVCYMSFRSSSVWSNIRCVHRCSSLVHFSLSERKNGKC